MALLKTIPEVKRFLRINYANANTSLPNMDRAERQFVVPLLGRSLYDDLVTKYTAGDTTPSFLSLLTRVQALLAPLAYWMELPLINTQITDIGLMKSATAEKQPVFKYDYNAVRSALLEQGMEEAEVLLEFLDQNRESYPLWSSGSAATDFYKPLIRTGKDFSTYYRLHQSRRCYLELYPTMSFVEEKFITAAIGEDFFSLLKLIPSPTPEEKKVLELLKRAVAYLTIFYGAATLPVKMTATGFTIQVADSEIADTNRQSAVAADIDRLRQETEKIGSSYLADAVAYLNKMCSPTLFATFYASPLYRDPNKNEPSLNSQLKSSFVL